MGKEQMHNKLSPSWDTGQPSHSLANPIYVNANIEKTNACTVPINMPKKTVKIKKSITKKGELATKGTPTALLISNTIGPTTAKIIAPPNILPNKRKECETSLPNSEIRLIGNKKKNGEKYLLIYFRKPFFLIAEIWLTKKTNNPNPKQVLRSAVGDFNPGITPTQLEKRTKRKRVVIKGKNFDQSSPKLSSVISRKLVINNSATHCFRPGNLLKERDKNIPKITKNKETAAVVIKV